MENNISEHISWKEATFSPTAMRLGINNVPNAEQLENMKQVAEIFEKVRAHVGQPLQINSFFRSEKLNTAIGGAKGSQHTAGQAMDIDSKDNALNKKIFDFIRYHMNFDQVISEFGTDNAPEWIHVSYSKVHNRKEVLRAEKINGVTVYRHI
jgi:zinc D-Ala-D-Ala carboxypeptidase